MKVRRDRADNLGLVGAVLLVLITECVLGVVVLAMKVHGVTLVMRVLGGLVGVVGSLVEVADTNEAELGVNFEWGRGSDGVLFLFGSGVTMFVFVLLATDLTELVLELNPIPEFRLCSLWEGVTLLFVVFLLSMLARNDTKSASASTLLKVAFFPRKAEPRGVDVVVGIWVAGKAL